MAFTHVIFDLDDTLYPSDLGLMEEVGRRITLWMQQTLGLSRDEASALRRSYLDRYGTTMGGLMAEQQTDVDDYLAFVHDVPVERYVRPDPALAEMLDSIPLRKVIFTNATIEHAQRVLQALELTDQFDQLVGIRETGLYNKAYPEAYERLLALLDARGPACIMVDDRPVNLQAARELGMTTILVEGQPGADVDFAVECVLQVGPILARLLESAESAIEG